MPEGGAGAVETYWHPTRPKSTARLVKAAEEVISGSLRLAPAFPLDALGFPPPWDADPHDDRNWLSSLHSLEWLVPLVHAHVSKPDKGYLRACALGIEDWIRKNPFRGAPSRSSWNDHAAAKRLRLFAWFWEQYRASDDFEADFARLLLVSVYQHALYHLDRRNYRTHSNHGLESIGALWAAAITFPMFRDAHEWELTAQERLRQWLGDNLSSEGFHLEQSPSYHWFVLLRLAAIDCFLRANGRARDELSEATQRAARAWPHLLKPDGAVPTVGDSSAAAPADWRGALERRWERPLPAGAHLPGSADVPESVAFIVDPRAGYAVFRAPAGPDAGREATYVLFRCRAFESVHCHDDALSFVLYGLGRDWIIDPGYLTYHEWDPRRRYLRGPRAHSLVIAADKDFRTGPNECIDWGRSAEGAYVAAYHDLPRARHTRRLQLSSPRTLLLHDHLQPAGRRPLPWAQLFQCAPDLEVRVASDREAHLVSPDGARCVIHQSQAGAWHLAKGEERPRLQGWYSESYGKWAPTITLLFSPQLGVAELESRLELTPSESEC